MIITSVNNELIKETAKLLKGSKYRDESGLFIIEGFKGIEEALDAGIEIVHIFSVDKTVEVKYDSNHLLGGTTNASDNQVVNPGGENTSVWLLSYNIDFTSKFQFD